MTASIIAAVTAVINLLDKVLQCVKNRSNGDSANIEDVKRLFSTLIAYLTDTEEVEATEGLMVRVDQVRDKAYETHDAIIEFLHHVPQHCHGHWFTKTCHDVAHFFKDFVPLRQFSSRMKAIERKLNNILRLDAFRVGTFGATSSSSDRIRTYSFSRNDHLLVGIEENKKALLSLACSEESKDKVISVIGDAGSGKTALICEVYQMIKENFNCNAWVSILPSREGLLENLWEALGLPAKTKMKRLHSYLQSKSYLPVFYGIWTEDELDCIKNIVPDNNLGGRILISTYNHNLASYRARSSDCFSDLKLLTEFGSWQLFCNKTFEKDCCHDLLVDCSEKIVKRSEGSLHVIVAVSNFLS
nr:disease resistance protein RPM1-like [Quercus suber]POE46002.1 disease resistance protein rpm1 [Quercus suber]